MQKCQEIVVDLCVVVTKMVGGMEEKPMIDSLDVRPLAQRDIIAKVNELVDAVNGLTVNAAPEDKTEKRVSPRPGGWDTEKKPPCTRLDEIRGYVNGGRPSMSEDELSLLLRCAEAVVEWARAYSRTVPGSVREKTLVLCNISKELAEEV